MRTWTRWQNWVSLVGGAYMMLVPLFVADSEDNATIWVAELLGAAIIIVALGALAYPATRTFEILGAVFGVALFVSPWLFGYSDLAGASASAWIVGAVVALLGLGGDAQARQLHHPGGGVLQH